ncbi:hypothetical protein C3E93_28585, partial [Klebsiella pneumoniae]
ILQAGGQAVYRAAAPAVRAKGAGAFIAKRSPVISSTSPAILQAGGQAVYRAAAPAVRAKGAGAFIAKRSPVI